MTKFSQACQLLAVLVFLGIGGYIVGAFPRNTDLAGGSRARVELSADTRDLALLPLPPASSSPVQDDRAAKVDESTSSSSIAEQAVDPGRGLLDAIAGDIGDDWMPSEGAFAAHVNLRVDNVASVGTGRVRALLGDEALSWPMYYSALQEDGYLADIVEMPTDADVRRLWLSSEDLFSTALYHWHRAAELEEAAYVLENRDGVVFAVLMASEEGEQFAGDHAWASIFHKPDAYAHWAFIMRVAERLTE